MLQAVNLKDRLPKNEGQYFVEHEHNNFETTEYFNGERFEVNEFTKIKLWYDKVEIPAKILELTVKESEDKCGVKDIKDLYFDITLVVDKKNRLYVYNSKDDGDWREDVDCGTLLVHEVKLRP